MYKKIIVLISLFLAVTILPAITPSALTPPPSIRVFLDGELLTFDVAPRMADGRVMVPMRAIFEALGAEVEWDEDSRTITATRDGVVIVATIGNPNMRVGDDWLAMDVTPMIVDGRTLVPIRFVSEAFGIEVTWREIGGSVYIVTYVAEAYEEAAQKQEPITLHRGRLMVMYHSNGGVGAPISNTITIGEDGSVRFRHPRAEPRKEGYTFIGWLLENDDNFLIDEPGRIVWVLDLDISRNETIVYFAQWERSVE